MVGISERPATLNVLPAGYIDLFDRAREVFDSKDMVRALWVSGSLARGTADAGSDLDLIVTVEDSAHEEFAANWREWLAEITPTVLAKELPFARGSFYSVTPTWERLDVIVERVSDVASTHFRVRTAVFDKDDLLETIPQESAPVGPSPEKLSELIEGFLRIYGMLPALVAREDWLLGIEGIHILRDLLYRMFVEANAPLPPVGMKQWSAKLTEEQREILEGLPTGAPSRDAVIEGNLAIANAFLPAARRIAAQHSIPWPDRLEAATFEHLRRVLSLPEVGRP